MAFDFNNIEKQESFEENILNYLTRNDLIIALQKESLYYMNSCGDTIRTNYNLKNSQVIYDFDKLTILSLTSSLNLIKNYFNNCGNKDILNSFRNFIKATNNIINTNNLMHIKLFENLLIFFVEEKIFDTDTTFIFTQNTKFYELFQVLDKQDYYSLKII